MGIKDNVRKYGWFAIAVLSLARLSGIVWIPVGVVGLLYFSFQVDMLPVLFLASVSIATFAPLSWFASPDRRKFLLIILLLGFLSPGKLVTESWGNSLALMTPAMQCLSLLLFIIALGVIRGKKSQAIRRRA